MRTPSLMAAFVIPMSLALRSAAGAVPPLVPPKTPPLVPPEPPPGTIGVPVAVPAVGATVAARAQHLGAGAADVGDVSGHGMGEERGGRDGGGAGAAQDEAALAHGERARLQNRTLQCNAPAPDLVRRRDRPLRERPRR